MARHVDARISVVFLCSFRTTLTYMGGRRAEYRVHPLLCGILHPGAYLCRCGGRRRTCAGQRAQSCPAYGRTATLAVWAVALRAPRATRTRSVLVDVAFA